MLISMCIKILFKVVLLSFIVNMYASPFPFLFKKKSANVYYLSKNGITDNANLALESNTFGVDQTSKIQAILDKALTGRLTVYWDVKCAITQLKIHSNTTIIASIGCGAIQLTGSNKIMFINYNKNDSSNERRIFTQNKNHNIIIDGGIWNQNGQVSGIKHQEHNCDNWKGFNNYISEFF